jgi:hypothetical protein
VKRVLLAALLLVSFACSDDDDAGGGDDDAAPDTTAAGPGTTLPGGTIQVTAVDYAFEGLPDAVAGGTRLSLANASSTEAHELVAVRMADDDPRTVEELLVDPIESGFFSTIEPATVIVAGPGQTDAPGPLVGDGTLAQPGRYVVVCLIPVGADPAAVLDPNGAGPVVGTGPPHAAEGMYAELTVA